LLLSLIHDADSKVNRLFALAAHAENFRKHLGPPLQAEQAPKSRDLPLSNASKRVLAYAAEEAHRLRGEPIGTEHLFLGLLRENKSRVPEALATAGIDLRSARNRTRRDSALPIMEHEPEIKETSPGFLKLIATPLLLIGVIALIYLIFRLVSS
jgi:ATP-dependent Clp protease ATP-binding subunit ClpA